MMSTTMRARPCSASCEHARPQTRALHATPRAESGSEHTVAAQRSNGTSVLRRTVLSAIALAPLFPGRQVVAAPSTTVFLDDTDKFSLSVPAGWERGEGAASGAIGTRRVVAFHPPGELSTNVSITSTNASVELTKISALGSPFEFGFRLVVSQNRPKDGQAAELLDTKERNGAYLVEYKISRPDEGINRHLYSLALLRFDGKYNRFFTVTGQYNETDADRVGSTVQAAVDSFTLTPL
jgi:PsbP